MIKRRTPEDVKLGDHEPEFPDRKPVDAPPMPKIKYTVFQWFGKQWRRVKKQKLKTTVISILVAIASSTFLGVDLSFLVDPIMEYLNPSNEAIMADLFNNLDFSSPESIIFSVLLLLAVGGGFLANYFKKEKLAVVSKELQELTAVLKKGRDATGPDGKKLTKDELKAAFHEALGLIEAIADVVGYDIDLDGDGQ